MTTGKRIRAAREAAGLYQSDVAKKIGASEPSVRMYELDRRTPKPEILEKIAKAVDVDPQSLVEIEISSARDALEYLFRIEDAFGLSPNEDGALVLDKKAKGAKKLDIAIKQWTQMHNDLEAGRISREEYDAWRARVK